MYSLFGSSFIFSFALSHITLAKYYKREDGNYGYVNYAMLVRFTNKTNNFLSLSLSRLLIKFLINFFKSKYSLITWNIAIREILHFVTKSLQNRGFFFRGSSLLGTKRLKVFPDIFLTIWYMIDEGERRNVI